MPCAANVRATLDHAAALASGQPLVRAVVVLITGPGTITVVGDPADRAMLPLPLRAALEQALRGPDPG